jgi:pyridoxine kinase
MNTKPLKRVAAIHDLSGFGKCSLTVALPILSAAGIETSVMPTAILSTHTGGIKGYTFLDTTGEMRPFLHHWKSLDLRFDAIYSGYLGSFEQLDIVKDFIREFRQDNNLVIVDPVMGDNGELYKAFTPAYVEGMKKLCRQADIIVPNATEAALLLDEEYEEAPYSERYINHLLSRLSQSLGVDKVVITGVIYESNPDIIGAATYNKVNGKPDYAGVTRIPGSYHGTGDVFASALVAGILNNFSLHHAAFIAAKFTAAAIQRTYNEGSDVRFGVNFEQSLPQLLADLKLL